MKNKIVSSYLGFGFRLISYLLLFFVLIILSCVYCIKSLSFATEKYVNYNESSNVNYKVYLKPNDFYSDDYLGMNRVYISSLIDNIDVNFDYKFNVDNKIDMNYSYFITAKLLIQDESSDNTFYEKEYYLSSIKNEELSSIDSYSISKNVKVDYNYYNDLAASFNNTYKVNTKDSLVVYLKINKKDKSNLNIDDTVLSSVVIPLSQQTFSISSNFTPTNNGSKLVDSTNLGIGNIFCFVFAFGLVTLSSICFIKFIRLLFNGSSKKSIYDKYVNRLLKEYDTVIVETKDDPYILDDSFKVIRIYEFKELLDVRDNLKLPIIYYSVTDHVKSYFYIKNNSDLYLYIVKSVDLEEKHEKKKK